MMYTDIYEFEWDDKKARGNALKHGIDFQLATYVFDDPEALFLEDEKHSIQERRQWLIGNSGVDILVVVFTERSEDIVRIISARKANNKERKLYGQNQGV